MMYDKVLGLSVAGSACSTITMIGGIETMNIIYLILGIIGLVLGIVSGVIGLIFKVKEALKDGKIDKDEAEDIAKGVKDLSEEVNAGIKELEEREKHGNRN